MEAKNNLQLVDEDDGECHPVKRRKKKVDFDVGSSAYGITKEERMSTRLKYIKRKTNLKELLLNCIMNHHFFFFSTSFNSFDFTFFDMKVGDYYIQPAEYFHNRVGSSTLGLV